MMVHPDHVPEITVHAAVGLGCDAASFRIVDESVMHRPLESVGLTEDQSGATSLAASMADLVLLRGELAVARLHPQPGEASLPRPNGDIVAAVATPIWIDGWIAAVLVGMAKDDTRVTTDMVSALGVLTSQAG